MVFFHDGFSIKTSKLMKPQASFFQCCSFICPSILLLNFLFISWILLMILSLTAVPKTCFHRNFLNFALFWCTILYSDWLKWWIMPSSDSLALKNVFFIKNFLKKSKFLIKTRNFLISCWILIKISTNSQCKRL